MDIEHLHTPWAAVEEAVPDFARGVRERFAGFRHHVLGTLRADGAPRLTGLEAEFADGELSLGMMPNSRKALDLRRDPRFGLYANPGSAADMTDGDARISGRVREVTDAAELAAYTAHMPEGELPPVFHLFRADVREVVRVSIEGEEIVFRVWTPEGGLRTIRRGNDDSPPRTDP